jgi:hypothetical protein
MMICRPSTPRHSAALALVAFGMALGSLGLACGGKTDDLGVTGSETHFLIECSETCASGLDCIDGVCTSPCSSDEVCASLSSAAVCTAGSTEARVCDVPCSVAADCATLGAGYSCRAGSCRGAALDKGTELAATELPADFAMLELRYIGEAAPGAGSNCDQRVYMGAYFVDLSSSQVSWADCTRARGTDVYVHSVREWSLLDVDREDLLATYRQLRVSAEDTCDVGAGMRTLDLTTVDSVRFGYADAEHSGCPVSRLGRTRFVGDLTDLYETLGPIFYDRPRGIPHEDSMQR